ncbi:ATP-binding protein [Amycolatopsis sp. NBC_01488]|uniref:ATP-binding protein n=1 Tax=Amycolatopsis sp. NBC_01488 TaxID=2903563 RepID=UPI002E27BDA2|nr:LuxR C-terminal-related transcriptional regulator [Amycolatopsis sp. NBC_01488]
MPPALAGGDTTADSATARFEAFEAVADQLRGAAEPAGLLVVLDDLQWADAASLALLVHAARGMSRSRLLFVATYRDTETGGREALTSALAALAHEAEQTRVRLVGLPTADVQRQLELATGDAVSSDVAAVVSRRTGGNPFFVNELAPLLEGDTLPDGVLDTVRARLARLSGCCRELIATAAALGSEPVPPELAAVTDRPVEVVLGALDEAGAAGLLVRADGWRFRHDLIREAARVDLPTATRAGAHARMAAWLAARPDAAERATEIAHHWLASLPVGEPREAVEWAERAGDQALDRLAWEQAADRYRQALDVGAPLSAGDRGRLLLRQATALTRNGDIQPAAAILARAAEAAREAGDPHALGAVALAMEGLSDPWGEFRGDRLAAEALAQLPDEDSPMRARLLALLAGEAGFVGGVDPERVSGEALAMAERLGDTRVLRSALRSRQMARSGPDGVYERLELAERMYALGQSEQDDETTLWGWLWRFDGFMMLGRVDDAEATLTPMRLLTDRLRRPLARWQYLRAVAAVQASRGRFDDAIATVRECLRLTEGRTHDSMRGVSLFVLIIIDGLAGRGDLLTAEEFELFDRYTPAFASPIYALYLARRGDFERAGLIMRRSEGPDAFPQPALLPALATRAELAAMLGEPDIAADMAARLRPAADLFVTGGAGTVTNVGSVRTYLGIAQAACGRLDEAVREIRLGITANDTAGLAPYAALARFELAQVLARRRRPGDLEAAAALCATATASAAQLGMAPLRHRADEFAATLRGDAPAGLTPREAEVAGHVAQGLTNKQVAALMHISERTAESHVQHILAKLGLANRTQIAAWSAQRS